MPFTERPGSEDEQRPRAHIHDSIPPAEHLYPPDLQGRLARVGKTVLTTEQHFQRACLYYEYAIATPEFEGDEQLFDAGNEDLDYIISSDLSIRDKIRFGASVLYAYEPVFRLRARSPYSLEVPREMRHNLQLAKGAITTEFLEGSDPKDSDYGLLSESIALDYLLQSDLFPYTTTYREEGNIYWKDNHDIYTLHPCQKNRIKKAPASIKHNKPPKKQSEHVVVLRVGRLSRNVAKKVDLELCDSSKSELEQIQAATSFAAHIIIEKLHDQPLTEQAQRFITAGLTASLRDPLVKFASSKATPDYASNAEALKKEIAAREKRERQWRNQQPLTHRIQMPNP